MSRKAHFQHHIDDDLVRTVAEIMVGLHGEVTTLDQLQILVLQELYELGTEANPCEVKDYIIWILHFTRDNGIFQNNWWGSFNSIPPKRNGDTEAIGHVGSLLPEWSRTTCFFDLDPARQFLAKKSITTADVKKGVVAALDKIDCFHYGDLLCPSSFCGPSSLDGIAGIGQKTKEDVLDLVCRLRQCMPTIPDFRQYWDTEHEVEMGGSELEHFSLQDLLRAVTPIEKSDLPSHEKKIFKDLGFHFFGQLATSRAKKRLGDFLRTESNARPTTICNLEGYISQAVYCLGEISRWPGDKRLNDLEVFISPCQLANLSQIIRSAPSQSVEELEEYVWKKGTHYSGSLINVLKLLKQINPLEPFKISEDLKKVIIKDPCFSDINSPRRPKVGKIRYPS